MKGTYKDTVSDKNGTPTISAWQSNHIVNPCHFLLAAFIKNDSLAKGIKYLAVGKGLKEWDGNVPEPPEETRKLVKELRRYKIAPHDIVYVGNDLKPTPGNKPSNRIKIEQTIKLSDFRTDDKFVSLREFGLFAGNKATDTADTGEMINCVIHPRIDISDDFKLEREIVLIFGPKDITLRDDGNDTIVSKPGARLPVSVISGISKQWDKQLVAKGIRTIGDLDKTGFGLQIKGLSENNLQQLRTKARVIMNMEYDLRAIGTLRDFTLESFLKAKSATIAKKINKPDIPPTRIAQQQGKLQILSMVIAQEEMDKITLGDLAGM